MRKNGVIIQDLKSPAFSLPKFKGTYKGINSFWTNPLGEIHDRGCKKLYDESIHKETKDGCCEYLEFISNPDLLFKYIEKCKEFNIEIRVLLIESDYPHEICDYNFPIKQFIGYEYCEIPFDSQMITDFDWYVPLHKYYTLLNNNGLFDNIDDAVSFKNAYDDAFEKGEIGDGEMDTYICKVYEVDIKTFIKNYTAK